MTPAPAETENPIRVMIVDDSAVTRWMIQSILDSEPDIQVAGHADNGLQALERIDTIQPDLVILDVEMPELDGIGALKRIRRTRYDLPVLMYSTLTEKSAAVTLEALALGAADYVTKPFREGGREAALEAVRSQLLPKIRGLVRTPSSPSLPALGAPPRGGKNLAGASTAHTSTAHTDTALASTALASTARAGMTHTTATPRAPHRIEAVVIGASTGGPNALTDVIPHFPATFPVPILIVQHMPPVFTQMFADRLDGRSSLRVVEATSGMRVGAGSIYIAPGGVHMTVHRSSAGVFIGTDDGPPEHSVKPAVDVLFRGAVETWGGNLLAVILTGMGDDGMEGCRRIAAAGGTILVQDEESSLVWGMPGSVVHAGLANEIVPLADIPGSITRLTQIGTRRSST